MALEITTSGSLSASKAAIGLTVGPISYSNQQSDMAGTHSLQIVQDIGTTYELIVIPAECATIGWCMVKNLDVTNFVEVGVEHSGSTFVAFLKVAPGQAQGPFYLAMGRTALFAKADTAACKLKLDILER